MGELTYIPHLISKVEAVKRGPLSRRQIEALEKEGKLPGVKIGKRFLINYEMLIESLGYESAPASEIEEKDNRFQPCPFCGGKATFDYVVTGRPSRMYVKIKCDRCKCSTNIFPCFNIDGTDIRESAEKSVTMCWNRRA